MQNPDWLINNWKLSVLISLTLSHSIENELVSCATDLNASKSISSKLGNKKSHLGCKVKLIIELKLL